MNSEKGIILGRATHSLMTMLHHSCQSGVRRPVARIQCKSLMSSSIKETCMHAFAFQPDGPSRATVYCPTAVDELVSGSNPEGPKMFCKSTGEDVVAIAVTRIKSCRYPAVSCCTEAQLRYLHSRGCNRQSGICVQAQVPIVLRSRRLLVSVRAFFHKHTLKWKSNGGGESVRRRRRGCGHFLARLWGC